METIGSARTTCPFCGAKLSRPLLIQQRRARGSVECQIIAEPQTLRFLHTSSRCTKCSSGGNVRYWHGFLEKTSAGKAIKVVDMPSAEYFFLSKKFGVALSWVRRWRYRMYLHRASFQGEGILLRLLDRNVQVKVRQQLSPAWVREILWRRAGEIGASTQQDLASKLLSMSTDKLILHCWTWYEPLMFRRHTGHVHAVFHCSRMLLPKIDAM